MKKIGLLALLITPLLFACTLTGNAPTAPTETAVVIPPTVAAPTDTPIPSDTPQPTETSTPAFDWVADFAEPLLQAIAGTTPTYEDIFSDPNSGWHNGTTGSDAPPKIDGEKVYDHGEYRVTAYGATPDEPVVCSGAPDENVDVYEDFVAEFDVKFISGAQGNWQLQFHRNIGLYLLGLDTDGNLSLGKCGIGPEECSTLAAITGSQIRLDNYNHVQLIVRDTRMAVYVNEIPTLYADDPMHTDANTLGYFSLNVCNAGPLPLETKWDNFRVWDISGLP